MSFQPTFILVKKSFEMVSSSQFFVKWYLTASLQILIPNFKILYKILFDLRNFVLLKYSTEIVKEQSFGSTLFTKPVLRSNLLAVAYNQPIVNVELHAVQLLYCVKQNQRSSLGHNQDVHEVKLTYSRE